MNIAVIAHPGTVQEGLVRGLLGLPVVRALEGLLLGLLLPGVLLPLLGGWIRWRGGVLISISSLMGWWSFMGLSIDVWACLLPAYCGTWKQ